MDLPVQGFVGLGFSPLPVGGELPCQRQSDAFHCGDWAVWGGGKMISSLSDFLRPATFLKNKTNRWARYVRWSAFYIVK